MSPQRRHILVQGTVQRVGYRHIIQGIARRNRVCGCIRNLEGYDVEIIAEGMPDDLARFEKEIQIQEYPIYVEQIEISEAPYTGEYSYFEIVRGSPEDELAERFDSAIAIFSRMEKKQDITIDLGKETVSLQKETLHEIKGVSELQRETLEEVRGVSSLQKETLELQRETLDEVKGISSLQKETLTLQRETLDEVKGISSLQKETLELQSETLEEVKGISGLQKETLDEVKGVRSDLNKNLTSEIAEMREELREIR